MDLALWYADGRVDGLLDLIENLPGASRYYEAIQNDPEMAEELARLRLNKGDDKQEWSPRVAEFGLTEHMLRDLIHEVRAMRAEAKQLQGQKPGDVQPFPAPRTEVDAAVERLEREWTVDFLGSLGFDESYI